MRYYYWGMWNGLLISEVYHSMWGMAWSCLKHMNFVLSEFMEMSMLLAAYGADIQLAQVYLWEALDYLCSLHSW